MEVAEDTLVCYHKVHDNLVDALQSLWVEPHQYENPHMDPAEARTGSPSCFLSVCKVPFLEGHSVCISFQSLLFLGGWGGEGGGGRDGASEKHDGVNRPREDPLLTDLSPRPINRKVNSALIQVAYWPKSVSFNHFESFIIGKKNNDSF